MSTVNKWKNTNIYGELNNYDLYTDATSTTLVTAAKLTTTGILECNQFKLNTDGFTGAILSNKSVADVLTDYALCIFADGGLNVNGKDFLYLKIDDNVYATLHSSVFMIDPSVELTSTVSKSASFKPTNTISNGIDSIGGSLSTILLTPVTLTTATTLTASDFFTSPYQFGAGYNPYGTYMCIVSFDIGSNISGSDTTTLTSVTANLKFIDSDSLVQSVFKQVDTNTHVNKGTTLQVSGIFNVYQDGTINTDLTTVFTKTGTGSISVNDTTTSIIITRIG